MPLPVEIGKPDTEGVLQVSKSRKLPILIDIDEMEDLFSSLGEFSMLDGSRPVDQQSALISKKTFLEGYREYIEGIKTGNLVDESFLQPLFSSMITCDLSLLYAIDLSKGRYLIKAKKPIIQLQRHHFIFSDLFHSGVMGKESVTWGIQFSYPQLCLDPQTKRISKVDQSPLFPNTQLFLQLAKWVRQNTMATPFLVGEKLINQPMRLGKNCFSWINQHPGLRVKKLRIKDVTSRKNPSISPQ